MFCRLCRLHLFHKQFKSIKMAKDTFLSRYSILLSRLEKGPASLDELIRCLERESDLHGKAFNVSQRTLQRDFKAIYEQCNIEIANERKGDRRYYIKNRPDSPEHSQRLLESFQMTSIISSAQNFSNTVFMESRQPKGLEHFHGLLHAINNKFIITFDHHKYWDDVVTHRKVHPLGLKESQGRWYLIAVDNKDQRTKTFGLDRIENLDISKTRFREKYSINLKNAFSHSFGIINFENEAPSKVKLEFTAEQAKYVKAYPLHHSQTVIKDADTVIIELTVYPSYDFIQEILSFGDEVKVLEPLSLVKDIKKSLTNALKQYGTK